MTMNERTYRNYMLAVLVVVLAFNYVDRLALGLVLQDIKVDLDLTDTQLGFLSGIAFAMFYSVMGIPIARWADRGNRVTVITVTTAVWSSAVALCGMAGSFVQLLLIRVGVAVGEAGCIPPAHSLIADYFTRAERPRAVATYMLGVPLSVVIGYFLAGWLNEVYGWRMTFMLLGIPGLVLAVLVRFTLREPRRGSVTGVDAPSSVVSQPPLRTIVVTLWRNRTFRHLLLCNAVVYFFGYGIMQWQPAFFIRSYGLETGQLGAWFAAIYGVGGLIGTRWGGEWATRRAAHDEFRQLKVMAAAYTALGAASILVYLAPNYYLAFCALAVIAVGYAAANGPLFALIQSLIPQQMRATSIAVLYLFANFIGMGLGPLAAGALSDALRAAFGEESLRYSLLLLSPGYLWGAWHLWQARRTVSGDMAAVRGGDDIAFAGGS
jgi:MFS family permease